MEGHRAVLVIAAVFIGYSNAFAQKVVHDARGFECGFIYEKTKGGKSGAASCSYTGETVFSSASRSLPRNEHCYTENVFGYEDFNLQIDLATNKVVWDREDGLAPFAFTRMVEYYMRTEKIGKEEATRRAAKPRPVPYKNWMRSGVTTTHCRQIIATSISEIQTPLDEPSRIGGVPEIRDDRVGAILPGSRGGLSTPVITLEKRR